MREARVPWSQTAYTQNATVYRYSHNTAHSSSSTVVTQLNPFSQKQANKALCVFLFWIPVYVSFWYMPLSASVRQSREKKAESAVSVESAGVRFSPVLRERTREHAFLCKPGDREKRVPGGRIRRDGTACTSREFVACSCGRVRLVEGNKWDVSTHNTRWCIVLLFGAVGGFVWRMQCSIYSSIIINSTLYCVNAVPGAVS